MMIEDFLCEVRSDSEIEHSEVEDCLSASIKSARRDPETGIVTLTINLVYTPLRPCRLQYYTHTHTNQRVQRKRDTDRRVCRNMKCTLRKIFTVCLFAAEIQSLLS